MDSALHGMSQGNFNLGVFRETNVTRWGLARESIMYRVAAMEALILQHIKVSVF